MLVFWNILGTYSLIRHKFRASNKKFSKNGDILGDIF